MATEVLSRLPTASDPKYADLLKDMPGFDRVPKKTLDQSDFLTLLTKQLVNQDPLEPQKDTEFIAQMTTFNSAEQMKDLVTSMKSFMSTTGFSGAQNYLGKYVTVKETTTAGTFQSSGTVSGVGYNDAGEPTVTIGSKTYAAKNVVGVRLTAPVQNETDGTPSTES